MIVQMICIETKMIIIVHYKYELCACGKNVSFKIFVIIILEPRQSFFWYHTTNRFVICGLLRFYCIVCLIPKEVIGLTRQPFFEYDNNKDI